MGSLKNAKIGIIGAGVSGLAAAKELRHYKPVVFEATDSIGGVWRHCCISSTKLQTPPRDFEFSDFPWPQRDYSTFPSYLEVLDYLHDYATHFGLFNFINFNSKVVKIRYVGGDEAVGEDADYGPLMKGHPVWEVAVLDQTSSNHDDHQLQWYSFELLVICIGKYGDVARMPEFPEKKGQEIFNGKVLHSIDYSKLDKDEARQLIQGKRVAVVGYKKSALDLAMECALANQGDDGQPCTMVIRTLHWTIPSYRIWGLPFFLFYSTRSSQLLYERPNQSFFRNLLCPLFSSLRKAVSKFIESYLEWKLPLEKYGLKPEHPFLEDYASCQMAILPANFFSEADKGKILFKRTSKWWFWSDGIEFEDNTKLEADVVILATGFDGKKKLRSLLPHSFSALLVNSSGVIPLYRGTIHPLIPNMAFVGYIESVSNLQMAEFRCKWLANLVNGKFKLPRIENMVEETREEMEIMKGTTRFFDRLCISIFSINHNDRIYEDMGESYWRKTNKFL